MMPWVVIEPEGMTADGQLVASVQYATWAMPFLLLGIEPPSDRNGGWMNPGCVE